MSLTILQTQNIFKINFLKKEDCKAYCKSYYGSLFIINDSLYLTVKDFLNSFRTAILMQETRCLMGYTNDIIWVYL